MRNVTTQRLLRTRGQSEHKRVAGRRGNQLSVLRNKLHRHPLIMQAPSLAQPDRLMIGTGPYLERMTEPAIDPHAHAG